MYVLGCMWERMCLQEALLDKATKKLERLKLQKQKLEAASTKQVELEELVWKSHIIQSLDSFANDAVYFKHLDALNYFHPFQASLKSIF